MPETSHILNVLQLGVKNDGSEDISAIINQATVEHALFFPAGLYKVSHPLRIQNPIYGEGYSRTSAVTASHSWLLSEIEDKDGQVGVIECVQDPSRPIRSTVNIENLSIQCHSQECGIRFFAEEYLPYIFTDKVGIFNVKGYGIYCSGQGSRHCFLQDLTIFGSRDYPLPGVGIYLERQCDARLTNIEVMGCRISLWLCGSYNYGSNLHLWTGPMSGKDNGEWWKGTRGIILERRAVFNGSQVYPDTSFYALEARGEGCAYHLDNLFYWEDGSTVGAHDSDGAFFHSDSPSSVCQIEGGEIAVMPPSEGGGRMAQVRIANQPVRNVAIRSDIPLTAGNLNKLCAGDEFPDYSVHYADKGYCRLADFVAAEEGCAEAQLYLDSGALYKLSFSKDGDCAPVLRAEPQNRLCDKWPLHIVDKGEGVVAVYVYNSGEKALDARLTTRFMGPLCRPIHYGLLRTTGSRERCKECVEKLPN